MYLKLQSVQLSHSVVSNALWPHELQHARPPCLSPTPRVHPNPRPLCWWCHPTISSSVVPFFSCPQSFPVSGHFQVSQLSASDGQRIGVSASASVLPMNTQDWSPLGWTVWISLQSKGLSRVFSNTTVQKYEFFGAQLSSQSNSHPYTTTGKIIALTRRTFVGKVMSLLFNMLSRFVITFLPRSKRLLISWLQSPSAVILEPPKIKSAIVCYIYLKIVPSPHFIFKLIKLFHICIISAHPHNSSMLLGSCYCCQLTYLASSLKTFYTVFHVPTRVNLLVYTFDICYLSDQYSYLTERKNDKTPFDPHGGLFKICLITC